MKDKNKTFDRERMIERILGCGDMNQIQALMSILDDHGFSVKQILEDIEADRERRELLRWT